MDERLSTIVRLLTLCILLGMLISAPLAQENEEPCSSRETVYPRVKTAILDEASYHGVRVRHAAAGERLDIIGSKRFGPWCWLQVSDGWLIDNARSLSSNPPDTATQSASAATGACYQFDKAYIAGNMNIRVRASTDSRVVARARYGDVFAVSGSIAGAEWCWLKINQGWLANTSRVGSTKPAQPVVTDSASPAASLPANVDNCCFVDRECRTEQEWIDGYWAYQNHQCGSPSAAISGPHPVFIDGSAPFVAEINAALDMMRERAPKWYLYVVEATDRIFENPNDHIASASSAIRTINIRPHNHRWPARYSPEQRLIHLAISLQHEACHIHRHHAGFPYNAHTNISEELACIALYADMRPKIDPKRIGRARPVVGPQHCKRSLENHRACRWYEE